MANEQRFTRTIDAYEQVVAKGLSVLVCVVVAAACLQLIASVGMRVINPATDWLGGELMLLLDRLLLILIALEVLQNLMAYLREHLVQIELVLVTALTAVARKVIVMPQSGDQQPWVLASLGVTVLSLAGAYWLVRRTLRQQPPQGLQ
jgi:LPXTG-motif cell wall-anchored protein